MLFDSFMIMIRWKSSHKFIIIVPQPVFVLFERKSRLYTVSKSIFRFSHRSFLKTNKSIGWKKQGEAEYIEFKILFFECLVTIRIFSSASKYPKLKKRSIPIQYTNCNVLWWKYYWERFQSKLREAEQLFTKPV
jgi:hypothetical protein